MSCWFFFSIYLPRLSNIVRLKHFNYTRTVPLSKLKTLRLQGASKRQPEEPVVSLSGLFPISQKPGSTTTLYYILVCVYIHSTYVNIILKTFFTHRLVLEKQKLFQLFFILFFIFYFLIERNFSLHMI